MFTGLVQATGDVVAVREAAEGRALEIAAPLRDADLTVGASVAVQGVCLTVTASGGGRSTFQAAFETLSRTTLGSLAVGARVNLEPSLRVGDPLGGHLVSGHVDGIATVRSIALRGDALQVLIDVPEALRRFIAQKGSVALDGVSLTVNEVDATGFSVGLIPHTLAVTTLGSLAAGTRLNLEVDVLARYVARLLDTSSGVSHKTLVDAGFLP